MAGMQSCTDLIYEHEENDVNTDVLKGKWKQIRGEAKKWWGELTDDELDQIAGERDKLVGKVQERYGWTREKAETEVDRRLDTYERTAS
jgi:uncharacterized protein YjbJ (UPF0337 family)